VTVDVVINTRTSYAGRYGPPVSTSISFTLTPSLPVNSSARIYLNFDHSGCYQPNIAVLWLVVLPVREAPASDPSPEIGYIEGVQPFYGKGPQPLLWAGSRAAHVKITISEWYA
jgi:hypothetical protein